PQRATTTQVVARSFSPDSSPTAEDGDAIAELFGGRQCRGRPTALPTQLPVDHTVWFAGAMMHHRDERIELFTELRENVGCLHPLGDLLGRCGSRFGFRLVQLLFLPLPQQC